jgi:hypothetical protein
VLGVGLVLLLTPLTPGRRKKREKRRTSKTSSREDPEITLAKVKISHRTILLRMAL